MKKNFKCQLCESSKFVTIQKLIRNAHFGNYINFDVDICKKCSLIQLNNFMSPEKTKNYYKYEYLKETYKYKVRPEDFINDQKFRGKEVYKFLSRNKKIFNKNISDIDLVDVGCDTGGSLDHFLKRTRSAEGVDPILESVKLAKELGYKVKHGFIENLDYEDNSKDLVILLGTIEHAYDLNKALKECRRILRPNGLIFIRWRSNNLWGSPIEYFNSNHYRYFNDYSIKYMANKHKLDLILSSKEEIENKPGAEYFILRKSKIFKPKFKPNPDHYKKIIKYFVDYNKKYLFSSIEYLSFLRENAYDLNIARKYITKNKKNTRSLTLEEPELRRTIIEAKEFVNYYLRINDEFN